MKYFRTSLRGGGVGGSGQCVVVTKTGSYSRLNKEERRPRRGCCSEVSLIRTRQHFLYLKKKKKKNSWQVVPACHGELRWNVCGTLVAAHSQCDRLIGPPLFQTFSMGPFPKWICEIKPTDLGNLPSISFTAKAFTQITKKINVHLFIDLKTERRGRESPQSRLLGSRA